MVTISKAAGRRRTRRSDVPDNMFELDNRTGINDAVRANSRPSAFTEFVVALQRKMAASGGVRT